MSWPVRGKRGLWGCGRCKEAQKYKSEVLSIPQRSLKPYCKGNFGTEVLWQRSRVSPPQDSWLVRKMSSNEVLLYNKRRSTCLIWSSNREKLLWRERLFICSSRAMAAAIVRTLRKPAGFDGCHLQDHYVRHTTFLYLRPRRFGIYRCRRIYVSDGGPDFCKRGISHPEEVESRLESRLLHGLLLICRNRCNWRAVSRKFGLHLWFPSYPGVAKMGQGKEERPICNWARDVSGRNGADHISPHEGGISERRRGFEKFKSLQGPCKPSDVRGKYVAVQFFLSGQAFRKQQTIIIVNTNNGTEAQNKLFKYGYLPTSIDKSVYRIAIMLVESFISDSYQHYLQSNLNSSSAYWRFSHTVSVYLHNRPPRFVKHCLNSRFAAAEYQATDVSPVNFWKGEFHVKFSSKSNQNHLVSFPTPSCAYWQKPSLQSLLPIKSGTFIPCQPTTETVFSSLLILSI